MNPERESNELTPAAPSPYNGIPVGRFTQPMPRTNWAGNVIFGAARVHRPESIDNLRRIVGEQQTNTSPWLWPLVQRNC